MTVRAHPLGLGESLGDDLIINGPLVHTGQVWWVHDSGSNAASPRGLERARPLATLAQAVSNAANGDIIVLMDGHEETISTASPLDINKSLVIVGSGQSAGKPTAKIGFAGSAAVPITVSADDVELRNIWFEAQGSANAFNKIEATGLSFRMRGCYMECGDSDDGFGLRLTGSPAYLRDCTFISTATVASVAPPAAVNFNGVGGMFIEGCVFDGGTAGWNNGWAIDCNDTAQSVDIRMENVSLLRGSDIRIEQTSAGYVLANVGSYAPRIDWSGATAAP